MDGHDVLAELDRFVGVRQRIHDEVANWNRFRDSPFRPTTFWTKFNSIKKQRYRFT
jgi:hypothetical protein